MPQYKLVAREESEHLSAEAEVSAAEARRHPGASNYVLGVVLFASSLFFAGMSTKLASRRLRVVMLSSVAPSSSAPLSGSRPRPSASSSEGLLSGSLGLERQKIAKVVNSRRGRPTVPAQRRRLPVGS